MTSGRCGQSAIPPALNVRFLLEPASIAIVGASERPGPGRQVIENLSQIGYSGMILPINPKYETILGHPTYPSIREASAAAGDIDAVAILLGRDRVLPILEEAAAVGVGGAWAFASGFAESGPEGMALQERLAVLCREHGIAFCGPNCVGFVNPAAATAAFSAPISPSLRSGAVAAVVQSGSIAMALINSARGIGFRTLVSSGNEAVLDCTDYLEHFVADPDTRVVLAFIEQLRRPDRFIELAEKARAAHKPLIVLKVGRSEVAVRATAAHTGALAGEDTVYDEVFRAHGVIRVHDLDEMLETAEAFVRLGADLPRGRRVGMLTVSGGEIGLIADVAETLDLTFPSWSERACRAFARALPDYADLANPLDAWGSGHIEETYAKCVDAAADEDIDLVMISQDGPTGLAGAQIDQYAIVARAAAEARRRTGKAIVAFSHLSGGLDPTLRELFAEGGVPFLQGTREGLLAAQHLVEYAAALGKAPRPTAVACPGRAERLLGDAFGRLDEIASKEVFRAYEIPSVEETLCTSAEEAVATAWRFDGPVALKVVSAALAHKTDAGAVALGVVGDEEVRSAFEAIVESAAARIGREAIRGVAVQRMVTDAVAEVIAGALSDPTFGPVVVFGLGGIAVELFKDRALGIPPLSLEDARRMIARTKTADLLGGFRGSEAGDVEALAESLVHVGRLAVDLRDRLVSVDINPLLVRPQGRGVVAVDGLIELTAPSGAE